MRTVNSFGNDEFIIKSYIERLSEPIKLIKTKGFKTGITYGIS